MGGALEEVFSQTRYQRCWFHKIDNVLNALPKSQQSMTKAALTEIWNAATRADVIVSVRRDLYSQISESSRAAFSA
ncbi:hypothetical protein WI57_10785 [Burkholderia cepacia]|nr:hypothetical protein WI47_23080 [Burkholderia cepacia]KVB32297.1 hypothetical protein WI57_10785 [Burkholderia cepacia]KVC00772.1 hypothetical protein WI66_07630 [Burkholderia cepacia]